MPGPEPPRPHIVPTDYGTRYRTLYEKHIIPGFLQDGEYEYHKIVSSAMNPEVTAKAIDSAHAEWMKFFLENPGEYRPGIGKWLKDGYWTRKPQSRDPPKRKSTAESMLDRAQQMWDERELRGEV